MKSTYQICATCVMDTTDEEISFDSHGVCSHCTHVRENIKPNWPSGDLAISKLREIGEKIRNYGLKKEYDCIIGVSGGVDSSYLLYVAKEIMKLKPLAVHVDAGWNSEIAVRNIQNLTSILDIDLITHVINWEEMRDLQLAYLKSSVANQDVPQDHAFFAKLYEFAVSNRIKFVLTGSNFSTESILPKSWGYNPMDATQLLAIHKRFGSVPLKSFPVSGLFRTYLYYPYIRQMKVIKPLNFLTYDKEKAMQLLIEKFGWVYYGGKHFESRWTRFFQSYYLPTKFGYDKRRPHLSSLIVSGQLSREAAIDILKHLPYDPASIDAEIDFVAKKLRISRSDLQSYIDSPKKSYVDYPNSAKFEKTLRIGLMLARKLRIGV